MFPPLLSLGEQWELSKVPQLANSHMLTLQWGSPRLIHYHFHTTWGGGREALELKYAPKHFIFSSSPTFGSAQGAHRNLDLSLGGVVPCL